MKNEVELKFDGYYFKGRVYPRVSNILVDAGRIKDLQYYTEQSAALGRNVHKYTQMLDEDRLEDGSGDPRLSGYYKAYRQWRSDYADRVVIKTIEKPVVNLKYKYAGTPDREMFVDGDFALLSIKTGVYARWHVLQEEAYSQCYKNRPCCYGLYLKDNGRYKFGKVEEPGAEQAWLACVTLYYWGHK